jgi:hypothetical protein
MPNAACDLAEELPRAILVPTFTGRTASAVSLAPRRPIVGLSHHRTAAADGLGGVTPALMPETENVEDLWSRRSGGPQGAP